MKVLSEEKCLSNYLTDVKHVSHEKVIESFGSSLNLNYKFLLNSLMTNIKENSKIFKNK